MADSSDASDPARPESAGGRPDALFPVVGLGASAGGIAALCAFFDAMPADSGMAFVAILHLDPGHASRLPQILGGHTEMPVVEAEDGMPIRPDRVHVIPPNAKLSLAGGKLQLGAIDEQRAERRPVDHFFASIAQDCGDLAIAAILSGTGSNGSAGIARVKESGGLVVVQDPATAEYAGMPGHAAGTGLADLIRPVAELPGALLDYVRHDRILRDGGGADAEGSGADDLDTLLTLLRRRTGHDFRAYKDAPVMRRIHRRMGLCQAPGIPEYIETVRENEAEMAALARDMMINVTGFFRDPEAWETLRATAIAPLVAEHDPGEPLRLWVPGCASGEEAYSLAMLVLEEFDNARKQAALRIFATDSNEDALALGRHGIYPASAVEELAAARIDRFFEREGDSFRVRKRVRDAVTFAAQNLLQDPPFSRLDLVSCRNVLIYLKPEFQRKLTGLFHFVLRQGGILFLGSVESPTAEEGMFETLSKRWSVYRRKGPTRREAVEFPLVRGAGAPQGNRQPAPPPAAARQDPQEVAKRALLERFAPPSLLVDRDFKVAYFFGETGWFLRHPDGEPTTDLGKILRDGLRVPGRDLVQAARDSGRTETAEAWLRDTGEGGRSRPVRLTATPAGGRRGSDILVSFEPAERGPAAPGEGAAAPAEAEAGEESDEDRRRRLEEDLKATRGELADTVRELEASNEDLKASNEEIMSMNEELQSSNEELESSKEELQSLNEELNTVNTQLQNKVQELETKSNDLNNLLNSTDTPSLFLDRKFHIRWFTPAISQLIELEATDVGRPFGNFVQKYADGDFRAEARKVLETLTPRNAEVRAEDGREFLRRILPYRTEDDRIDGVVVTFTDITERKRAEREIAEARDYAEAIVDTVRAPLLGLDGQLRVRSANAAFYRQFRVDEAQTKGGMLYELGNGQWDIPELRRLMGEILPQQNEVQGFEVEHEFPAIGRRIMLLNARTLDGMDRILLSIEDVTDRRLAEDRQRRLIGELNHRVKNVLNTVQAIAWQTLRRSASLEEFQRTFGARIQALAGCHDVLVHSGWQSAGLSEVLNNTLAPHVREAQDTVRDDCRGVSLPPTMALGLTLMLHELATNAAKYGALSTEDGRLDVHCFLGDGGRLHVVWQESGGPKPTPPDKKGFGLSLIEGTVRNELGGEISLDFREQGLRAEAEFPAPQR
jgi:two-component system CheB/CheR fusion protein